MALNPHTPVQSDGPAPTCLKFKVDYNTPGAATGVPVGSFPDDTLIFLVSRKVSFTGGTSPAVAIGTTATGTEIATAAGTTVLVSPAVVVGKDDIVYISVTGTPTGGSASGLIVGFTIED